MSSSLVLKTDFGLASVVDPGVGSRRRSAVAINQGSFSRAYNIGTGLSWKISVRKAPRVVYE